MNSPLSRFVESIVRFNMMYRMPVNPAPVITPTAERMSARLEKLKQILLDEVMEIDVVIEKAACFENNEGYRAKPGDPTYVIEPLEVLTDLADLLGDLQVYCASEMVKFGLPVDLVLDIIMESNFSKLGEDGQPIFDTNGKLQKGPNYWKPEPRIHAVLSNFMNAHEAAEARKNATPMPPALGAFDPLPGTL